MPWIPTPLQSAQRLQEVLTEQSTFAGNKIGSGASYVWDEYQGWAAEAIRMLRPLMASDDLDRLIRTPDYWSLRTLNPSQYVGRTPDLVNQELARAQTDLRDASENLRQAVLQWSSADQHLILPDTNFYIHNSVPVELVNWNAFAVPNISPYWDFLIIVPLIVVDELDKQKRGNNKAQARHTLERLAPLLNHPNQEMLLNAGSPGRSGAIKARLFPDDSGRHRLPRPDDEIVERAAFVEKLAEKSEGGYPRKVTITTYDGGMAARANLAGLRGLLIEQPEDAWNTKAHPWPRTPASG